MATTPQPDPALVLDRLDQLAARIDELTARARARDELIEDLTPIARDAMAQIGRASCRERVSSPV